jgi:acetyl esterase/lipase
VYYFCGGGFQSPPSSEHWLFLTKLAKDLALGQEAKRHREVEITVVSHPLAPASPAAETLPILRRWLMSALDDASRKHGTVTLAGDSSGGNIALSLGLWAVQHYSPPPPISTALQLVSVLVISPAVDLRNINPGIAEADKHDPVLTVGLTSQVAQAWAGNVASEHTRTAPQRQVNTENPDVSPLLNEDVVFEEVKDQGVSIHGVVGTHDVLAPDALELMRKCERLGVKGKWLVWEGQMHCFPLAGVGDIIGLREGKEGRRWVEEVLRGDTCRI